MSLRPTWDVPKKWQVKWVSAFIISKGGPFRFQMFKGTMFYILFLATARKNELSWRHHFLLSWRHHFLLPWRHFLLVLSTSPVCIRWGWSRGKACGGCRSSTRARGGKAGKPSRACSQPGRRCRAVCRVGSFCRPWCKLVLSICTHLRASDCNSEDLLKEIYLFTITAIQRTCWNRFIYTQ